MSAKAGRKFNVSVKTETGLLKRRDTVIRLHGIPSLLYMLFDPLKGPLFQP